MGRLHDKATPRDPQPRYSRSRPPIYDPRKYGADCDSCPLKGCTPVPAESKKSAFAIVSKAPGSYEEKANRFFAGPTGEFIADNCAHYGVPWGQFHKNNVLLCNPSRVRLSQGQKNAALKCCAPRLENDLKRAGVTHVLSAGPEAFKVLDGRKGGVHRWCGPFHDRTLGELPLKVLHTIQPAFALNKPALRPVFGIHLERFWEGVSGKLKPWRWPRIVIDPAKAVAALEKLLSAKILGIDVETNGVDPVSAPLTAIGIASGTLGVSIPWPIEDHTDKTTARKIRRAIKKLLASPIPKSAHNGVHDLIAFERNGFLVNGYAYDTILMHAVVAPDLKHDLGFACSLEFNNPRWKSEHGISKDEKGLLLWDPQSAEDWKRHLTYNARDSIMSAKLPQALLRRFRDVHNAEELYQGYLRRSLISRDMRERGWLVNTAARTKWFETLRGRRRRALGDLRKLLRAVDFALEDDDGEEIRYNPLSSTHRSILFFEHLNAPIVKVSAKTGNPSTDEKVLQRYMRSNRSVLKKISGAHLRFRRWEKLLSTYVLPYRDIVHAEGRVFGTRTGRWAYKNPNLQNIPTPKYRKGKKGQKILESPGLRDLLMARDGCWIVEADYSQLELRIIAILSGDPILLDLYKRGEDVHTHNARSLFGVTAPTKTQRDLAKRFVYACVPMDTQALTRDGWKHYKDLKVGMEVLTYNAKKNAKEWKPIQKLHCYDSAPVTEMSLNKRSFSVRSTPNHRWFVKQRRGPTWDRTYRNEIRTTEEINTESNIIVNAPMPYDPGAEFDADLLKRPKYGYDWTSAVCKMSTEERQTFLAGFLIADGWQQGRKTKQWNWSQNKGEIAEAVLTASYLENEGAVWCSEIPGKDMVAARLGAKQHITGQLLQKRSAGESKVWCMTTENGSWVMRQGNTICITGNSNYGADPKTVWASLVVDFPNLELDLIADLMDIWYREHNRIRQWQRRSYAGVKAHPDICLQLPISGRRYYFYDREKIERTKCSNIPVQGTGADIIDRAIEGLARDLRWDKKEGILAQVHDALVCETDRPLHVCRSLKKHMEQPIEIPGYGVHSFPIDFKIGRDWGSCTPYDTIEDVKKAFAA